MRSGKRLCICALLTTLIVAGAAAEQVRGIVVVEIQVPSDASFERTVELGLEEAAVIDLEADTHFLEGIRVEVVLSNELKKHFDSYALGIYKNLSPTPRKQVRFYTGERALYQYLPYLNRIYIHIPFAGTVVEEPAPVGTYRLQSPVRPEDFPLLLTMIPLSKGIPATIADKKFYFTVKPLLERKGITNIRVRFPSGSEGETIRLFVDGVQIQEAGQPLELPSGIHKLRIVSSSFKEINTSFAVESGVTSVVEVDLEILISRLTVEAPLGTELYLDGEKISNTTAFPLPIGEGNHLVRAKIADHSVSKKFTVEPGKHYHISIIFDIIVKED